MVRALLPVVKGSPCQDDGVLVGPLGGVTPDLFYWVPEMASGRVSHYPLWETAPDMKGEVNLEKKKF